VLDKLIDSDVFFVNAIEANKTEKTAFEAINEIVKLPTKRNTNLIVIGGGIVQDVSCFVSSVLYRGISWHFIPTTLLAQADSCIGSKSSLNYEHYKNLIGTFYPPEAIYISTSFLPTLEYRDFLSGIGEMFKCALMAGKEAFYETSAHLDKILQKDNGTLVFEINKALSFKKKVIEIDEFDRDYRNIMNYGHTFGHALESNSNFAIPHGQAVSIGILIANEISMQRGILRDDYAFDIFKSLVRVISNELLQKSHFSENLISIMKKDKKFAGLTHTCILLDNNKINKCLDVTDDEIRQALDSIVKKLLI
ncbi:MAG: 3-dehydroquinate synthase, partial [Bacilli bacterium]